MFVIMMGVSGSGKSLIGKTIANRLNCPFYEGDDYHPKTNVEKMANGIPLNDEDRAGWLAMLADIIHAGLIKGQSGVIACSALKEKYRQVLRVNSEKVKFVYLKGSYKLILARMKNRKGHYMKPGMLNSQFDILEEPTNALIVDISQTPGKIAGLVMAYLIK